MLFVIDIDGTIAGADDIPVLLTVCNEQLKLGLSSEQLQTVSYHAFLRLPAVEACQERMGKKAFEWSLAWAPFDSRCLLANPPLDGAVDGVAMLAKTGLVAYYTARYSSHSPEKNGPMAEATLQWLQGHGFAHPSSVVFCDGVKDKLIKVAELLLTEPQEIMLIDDRYQRLLKEYAMLEPALQANLNRHMILVAYGSETVPEECYGLRVFPLSDWRHVDRLFSLLDRPYAYEK